MPVDVGDFYPITIQTRAEPVPPALVGELADTDDVTVTITDATTGSVVGVPASMAHTGTGIYSYDPLCSVPGQFRWTAVATGAIEGTWSDVFTVVAPATWISVEEALATLQANTSITSPRNVEQLRWICQAACDAIERDLGLVIGRRTITDMFDGGRPEVNLRKRPLRPSDGGAISDLVVTEYGITLTEGTDFTVRRNRWSLVRGTGLARQCWTRGFENISVTYTVTCDPIPFIARKAALNAIARMWQQQQMPHPAMDDLGADNPLFVTSGMDMFEIQAYKGLVPELMA